MKTIIILAGLLAFSFTANAQKVKESEVPAAVKTQLAAMFPGVKADKWEMENGKYEAEFKQNKIETSVLFEANGTYVQTETEIAVSELPDGVKDYVSKNLSGRKIKEAAKIASAEGSLTYEAEIGGADYMFDANGNFLRKETEKDDTEDK
jgi:putative PepSY-like beta-lactamase-inhibitor